MHTRPSPDLHFCLSQNAMYADARIFTVIQLRNYLGGHKVLAKHPASYRQAELYKLYAKHLADRPRLDPHKFDWPGKRCSIFGYLSTFEPLLFLLTGPLTIDSNLARNDITAPAELTIFGLRWALDQYELSYDSGTRREDLEQLYVDLKTHQYDEGAPKRTRGDGLPFLVKAPSPLVKVLPPRARPAWLKRQHTRKIESEEQSDAPQPHPLRRSPRINATNKVNKNNSTSTLLTTMDETHRDVTTGKKGTARRTDVCYRLNCTVLNGAHPHRFLFRTTHIQANGLASMWRLNQYNNNQSGQGEGELERSPQQKMGDQQGSRLYTHQALFSSIRRMHKKVHLNSNHILTSRMLRRTPSKLSTHTISPSRRLS